MKPFCLEGVPEIIQPPLTDGYRTWQVPSLTGAIPDGCHPWHVPSSMTVASGHR